MTIDQLLNELWLQKTPMSTLAYDAIVNLLGKDYFEVEIIDLKVCMKTLLSFLGPGDMYDDLQSVIALMHETDWTTR